MRATMKEPDFRMIFGRGGKGKTYLTAHMLDRIGPRQLIYDVAAQDVYVTPKSVIVETASEVLDVLLHDARAFRIIWRGRSLRDDFDRVNAYAYALGNLTLVWEEVDHLWPGARMPEHGLQIVNMGRHRDLHVIANARRPNRVNRDLTALASRIVCFQTHDARDLKYLGEFIGDDAGATIRDLGQYQALDWTEAATATKKSPFA